MPFPDERDRTIIRRAETVENLAIELNDWLSQFNAARRDEDLLPVPENDVFEVLQLRRKAGSLYKSARVPVAAAVYGPSQVGKSLFVGQVLKPHSDAYSPLGRDENSGEPAYYRYLSFDNDLNPQSGSNEATALVTRFTTKDRIADSVAPEYPVMVKALTRMEWLRVLARGFHGECKTPDRFWQQNELEDLFQELGKEFPAQEVDRKWRMDLLDAFSYMRNVDRRGFPAKEAVLNGLLSRYALSEDGYVAAAAALFWDDWQSLTELFIRINAFLNKISLDNPDPAMFVHWAGVRFLLDSQRTKVHERPSSQCFTRVAWADFHLRQHGNYYVLEYRPGSGNGALELEIIQAGMLELVMPILPQRLNEDWQKVIAQMDFLDIPGMRAGRQGPEEGKRTSADTLDEQMEIVKRGKVSYLFERYTEELQIQTLLLLLRGGNLEVQASMKANVDRWGRSRYGEKVWPAKVRDTIPALFVGMTGLDEEFRTREEGIINTGLYDTRLGTLVDVLGSVMTDFGGKDKNFTNVYPIRYPGTWDTNEEQRKENEPGKWRRAARAFQESKMVLQYVAHPTQKWEASMRDDDGGLSLISAGVRTVTKADEKQDQLQREILEVENRLLQLGRSWAVDPDANVDREKRIGAARKVLQWLGNDEQAAYQRVLALRETMSMKEGDELTLSDSAESGRMKQADNLTRQLRGFIHEWATTAVPKRWEEFIAAAPEGDGGPWLDPNDFNSFVRYLCDYLLTGPVFEQLSRQLAPIINLKIKDEAARRHARRKYVRIVLNDFLMNPGGSMTGIPAPDAPEPTPEEAEQAAQRFNNFGLMGSFMRRWTDRLPQALALGAGEHVQIPPGNAELIQVLDPFDK
jgi:hypothetical protein